MIKTCDDGEERIRKVWRNHTWSVPLILPFHWLPNTTPCRCPLPRNLLKKNPLIPAELPASPQTRPSFPISTTTMVGWSRPRPRVLCMKIHGSWPLTHPKHFQLLRVGKKRKEERKKERKKNAIKTIKKLKAIVF